MPMQYATSIKILDIRPCVSPVSFHTTEKRRKLQRSTWASTDWWSVAARLQLLWRILQPDVGQRAEAGLPRSHCGRTFGRVLGSGDCRSAGLHPAVPAAAAHAHRPPGGEDRLSRRRQTSGSGRARPVSAAAVVVLEGGGGGTVRPAATASHNGRWSPMSGPTGLCGAGEHLSHHLG